MASLAKGFIVPVIAAHAIAALTMMFIHPKDSGTRFTAVLAIAALCFQGIAGTDRSTDEGQMYAEYMFGFILHANCFLVLLQLSAPKLGKTYWQRFQWAFIALFSPRRKLPKSKKATKSVPASLIFVTLRVVQVLALGMASNYLIHHDLLPFRMQAFDITSDKDSLVVQLYHGTLTQRDLLVRAQMAFLPIVMPGLLLSIMHALCSAFAVLLLNSDPARWPPLFGNILDAWSVRRWYTHFWPQLMRKAFTLNASYLSLHVFKLRPASTAGKCCITMLSFAMSGFMHTVAGWRPGPCASWMPMWTYLATGVVILVERGVQTLYARHVHSRKGLAWRWSWWEVWGWRLVGYCWVLFWWLEVIPWATVPDTRCDWAVARYSNI